jgi:tetratricopeptide (TPR) repeat protein
MALQRTIPLILLGMALTHIAGAHEFSSQMKEKKYPEVERAVNARLLTDPDNLDALVVKTKLIMIEGKDTRLDEAARLAEQCIAAHPRSSECQEALGNVLGTKATRGGIMSALGYAGKIRDAFKKAVELDPNNYKARSSLLQYYLQAPAIVGGGKGKAQALITDTAKLSPAAASLFQATLDLSEDKTTQAETMILTANPGGSETVAEMQRNLLVNVGHSYLQEKKYADSERVFLTISQRYPANPAGSYGMGKSLQEQGKQKDAIPYFEKAIVLEANAYTYYSMAQCLQVTNDKVKAISAYEKALAISPHMRKKMLSDAQDQLTLLKG